MSALVSHSPSTRAMWEAFVEARSLSPQTPCSLVTFGDSAEMMDDLAALVLCGRKRATTSLLRWYGAGGERYPVAGDYFIVVDAEKRGCCVCRMTAVRECAFEDVDERYAFIEGEGDRTRASWRADHAAFFEREARESGFVFDASTHVVLEYFEVLWPVADA